MSRPSRLEGIGWKPAHAAALGRIDAPDLVAGRVIAEHKGTYRVAAEDGDFPASLGGSLRHDAAAREDLPAVGDWVALRIDAGLGSIRHVLPRASALTRRGAGRTTEAQVVAANLDVVFFVLGLDRPFRPASAERALALVRESGAVPVIVLNKADLAPDPAVAAAAAAQAAPGVPVHLTSAEDGSGIDALAAHLGHGRTGAFFGPSGVGKSSLVNRLIAAEVEATGEVRTSDRRGRHTTTARELHPLPGGGVLIDTPGVREIGLWDGGDDGLDAVFADLEALAAGCRFADCSHDGEPGCAVRTAVGRGALDERRLRSYLKLRREASGLARSRESRARIEESRRSRRRLQALRRRAERRE